MSSEKKICDKFSALLEQIINKKEELKMIKQLKTPCLLFEYALDNNKKYIDKHVIDDINAWFVVYVVYIKNICVFMENCINRGVYILSDKSIKNLSNNIIQCHGVTYTIDAIYNSMTRIYNNINNVYCNIELFKYNKVKPKHVLKTTQILNEMMFETKEISLKSLKKLTKCIYSVLCDYIPK